MLQVHCYKLRGLAAQLGSLHMEGSISVTCYQPLEVLIRSQIGVSDLPLEHGEHVRTLVGFPANSMPSEFELAIWHGGEATVHAVRRPVGRYA